MSPDTARVAMLPSGETTTDRVEFETLISDISARLIAAAPEQAEPAIEAALFDVRVFFEADRCALIVVHPDQRFGSVAHESYSEILQPVGADLNLVELWPWASRILLVERGPVIVRRMDDLPPEAAVDRVSWTQVAQIRSNLAVPVCAAAAVSHVLVLHWLRREFGIPDACVPSAR